MNFLKHLSPNHLFVISVSIVILSIITIASVQDKSSWAFAFGAAIGIAGLIFNNAVAMRRDAVSRALQAIEADENLKNTFNESVEYLRLIIGLDKEKAKSLFLSEAEKSKTMRGHILDTLNKFERIAISIEHKEIDEEIVKDYLRGLYIEYYDLTKGAFPYLRGEIEGEDSPIRFGSASSMFSKFEARARKWKM